MTRPHRLSTHMTLVLLAASILWALCGAPLTAAEFAAVPDAAMRMLRQTPRRMLAVLAFWLE
ncbi:MAG: hypothetical protein IKK21_01995 [Clostridia bacterium]|nr:hypothetical protein [Clostridia bacterium]